MKSRFVARFGGVDYAVKAASGRRSPKAPASEGGRYNCRDHDVSSAKGRRKSCVWAWAGSDAEDHDFGGFDEGGGAFAGLEAEFAGGVGGDERSDLLFADAESDLGEEAVVFDGDDAADELIAAGDFAEGAAAFGDIAAVEGFGDEAIDFGFGDAMMATGSLGGFEFAAVDPLFESGIADAEDVGGFAWWEETLHGFT